MDISWFDFPIPEKVDIKMKLHTGDVIPLSRMLAKLYQVGTDEYDKLLKRDEDFAKKIDPNAVRRVYPTVCYNCHSVSLASRRGWLNDAAYVLDKEQYSELQKNETILDGDLLAYFDSVQGILRLTHTAIIVKSFDYNVDEINNNNKLEMNVVSKWGSGGEYIHSHNKSPYNGKFFELYKVFRFNRTHY